MRALALAAIAAGCSSAQKVDTAPLPPPLESYFPLAGASDRELCAGLVEQIAATGLQTRDRDAARPRRKIVISDLHLGPGSAAGRRFDGLEDFTHDGVLVRFLAANAGDRTDLIINGDFLELWQIEGAMGLLPAKDTAGANGAAGPDGADGPRLGANQRGSLAALDVIFAAHPRVFDALARFIASGDNRLILIAGNHDSDLIWPAVQLRVARELGVKNLDRLVFVSSPAYRHAGVHVEHGHRLDGANAGQPGPTVALDREGVCRLQSSWGQVFVAEFFNQLERSYPFVDNLYPESAALIWGMGEEPSRLGALSSALRFIDHLFSAQSLELNASALRGAITSVLGSPYRGDETSILSALWEAIPTADRTWAAFEKILVDPQYRSLRDGVIAAVSADSLLDAAAALASIDLGSLSSLGDLLITEPSHVAATEIATYDNGLTVVVFGHSHHPGGDLDTIDFSTTGLHVANTGAWVPVTRVADLKKRGLGWTDLSLADRQQFPARFPAVVIEYDGLTPQKPRLIDAR